MPRYFTNRASSRRLWVEDETFANEGPLMPSLSVSDHEATDTGLLDQHGDTIMRAQSNGLYLEGMTMPKLPIGAIARFALKRIVLPAIGKAIADGKNPLDRETAERQLRDAIRDEAFRQAGRVI